MTHDLVIWGHPVVLKNQKQLVMNKRTGKTFIKSNPRVEAYQHKATEQLCFQWGPRAPIRGPVHVRLIVLGAWRAESKNIPDLSNLYQMPEDLLQSACIIDDDRQIVAHDGSRRVCLCDGPCPKRPLFKAGPKKGTRKPSCGAIKQCPYERVLVRVAAAKEWTAPVTAEEIYTEDTF